jgi:hypothetical protein
VIYALEDAEDHRGFEAAIIAEFDAQFAVQLELVLPGEIGHDEDQKARLRFVQRSATWKDKVQQ